MVEEQAFEFGVASSLGIQDMQFVRSSNNILSDYQIFYRITSISDGMWSATRFLSRPGTGLPRGTV